jgi:altronate dehydratase small subunit
MDGQKAIVIDSLDNVATAIQDLASGESVQTDVGEIVLLSAIPFGHKFALVDLPKGDYIIKYGCPVGRATAAIAVGEHVHVHNVEDIVDEVRKGE